MPLSRHEWQKERGKPGARSDAGTQRGGAETSGRAVLPGGGSRAGALPLAVTLANLSPPVA